MEHILLVEPDYDNKYPPIGLMKIATYYKSKGDYVEFYKGKAPYNLISKMSRLLRYRSVIIIRFSLIISK